jgi:hypothetical protein
VQVIGAFDKLASRVGGHRMRTAHRGEPVMT